jgi:hypothetical protein
MLYFRNQSVLDSILQYGSGVQRKYILIYKSTKINQWAYKYSAKCLYILYRKLWYYTLLYI